MKKLSCFILLAFVSMLTFAQDSRNYKEYTGWLRNNGYTITEDRYVDLVQGSTGYIYKTFYTNTTYKILAFADDADVTDVDVYLYENGHEYSKDTKVGALAQLDFDPTYQREMKVEFKNYKAKYGSYAYKIRLIIAFK